MSVTVDLRGVGDARLRAIVADGFPELLLELANLIQTSASTDRPEL